MCVCMYVVVCAHHICASIIITPRTCARGKEIGFVCHLSSVATKIARSPVLGICTCCNYHKLVDISGKTCFCALGIAEHGSLALQIMHFLFSMPVVY